MMLGSANVALAKETAARGHIGELMKSGGGLYRVRMKLVAHFESCRGVCTS
jgi:hypothetical protein